MATKKDEKIEEKQTNNKKGVSKTKTQGTKKSTAKKTTTNKNTTTKSKNTTKKSSGNEKVDTAKEIVDKTVNAIEDEAAIAADKISKFTKAAASKVADVANEIKEENKDTEVVTKSTMSRVFLALIIVALIWLIIQIFGLFSKIGENLFGDNDLIEDEAETYLSNFSTSAASDDVDCDVKSHNKYGYVLKCELDSFSLRRQWDAEELYLGVKENNGNLSYCAPALSKTEVKKCLKNK